MMLAAIPWYWKLAGAAAAAAALCGGWLLLEHSIYQRGFDAASAACAERARKQEQLIEQVKADADRAQDALEFKILMLERDNANVLEQIDAATAADPLGGDVCLSAGSVLRLNAIR